MGGHITSSLIYALYVGLGFRSLIGVYTELTKVTALYAGGGRNWTGKSTLLNLLCKLYEIENGSILIDGKI